MTDGHSRRGIAVVFAVVGGFMLTLLVLGGLILRGGGGELPGNETFQAASDPAELAGAPVADTRAPSRSAARRVLPGADPAWAARFGSAAGIPAPAMLAYGNAELTLDKEQPGCHLSWNTLAGIGWIESHHGTIGDRALEVDGHSSPPIIGPALNGQGFAAIRSTPESARWHGDTTWEHAVGPLQFIASTWKKWGADGDHDGVSDPLDLDDAALAAGHYLCADGKDLATAAGWNAAVHSYNHDQQYVLDVLAAANSYAERTAA
ncbi:MAG: Membrane-bound lytic murein transglycosylase B-like protein [Marmoricola sp.]|nr:Membrane-bound lytic murein transglycosylase B-like protein [Marmoricola sp.]